jgi:hypothetical protein
MLYQEKSGTPVLNIHKLEQTVEKSTRAQFFGGKNCAPLFPPLGQSRLQSIKKPVVGHTYNLGDSNLKR